MEELKLANILPYTSHVGVELYFDDTRLEEDDYLKVMKDSYNYIVIGIRPYSDEKLQLNIKERESK